MSAMLDNVPLKPHLAWEDVYVPGSAAAVPQGHWATEKSPKRCNPNWFSGPSTIILGPPGRERDDEPLGVTHAEWTLPIPKRLIRRTKRAMLIIACQRESGGLHSSRKHAQFRLFFNGKPLDERGLKDIPPRHDDYFYRPPTFPLPPNMKMPQCHTVYTWTVTGRLERTDQLRTKVRQTVRVEMDKDVNWDIDYVDLVMQTSRWPVTAWIWLLTSAVVMALVGLAINRGCDG